jgi:hypothetical protein
LCHSTDGKTPTLQVSESYLTLVNIRGIDKKEGYTVLRARKICLKKVHPEKWAQAQVVGNVS